MEEQRAGNRGNTHIQQGDGDEWTSSPVLALLAVLLAGGITLGGAGTSWSESEGGPPPPQPFSVPVLATFQSGRITDVHGTTVQIDQRDYELRPDVQIQNPQGMPMEAHDIRKRALAKFHLKQGRIDMLVVILPD
jgi:hypothetical protein